jgi:hypothetical protein
MNVYTDYVSVKLLVIHNLNASPHSHILLTPNLQTVGNNSLPSHHVNHIKKLESTQEHDVTTQKLSLDYVTPQPICM